MDENNKRIAKNTIFLYFRMLLIMFVSLYTSRVTLKILGVDDFGIYQTVGGVVTFLAFISNALSSGTSRFMTYEIGKENSRLDILFSTVRIAHIVLGIAVVLIGELVGIWFINHKLLIPSERLHSAFIAFHFSMLAIFFQITQVPFNAMIIAHEKMNAYAYVSIAEAILKLLIVYMLNLLAYDKLEVYSFLICVVTIIILLTYRIYCRHNFREARTRFQFDTNMFSEVATFSLWSLIGSSAASFANQGVTIVTNMFFLPATVTVRSLALRVNNIVNQFINNFRTAVNPQIVKKYAAKDFNGSKSLLLASTKYSYYLTLLIVLPLFLLTEPALKIWLGDIPVGTIGFVKFSLIQGLFQALDASFYVAIYAKGQIRENSIISPLLDFIQLPVVYVLFKLGFPSITLVIVETCACLILGVVVKPILVHYVVNYSFKEIYIIIANCSIVTVLAAFVPLFVSLNINCNSLLGFVFVFILSIVSLLVVVWFIGFDEEMKKNLVNWIKTKIFR